MAYLRISVCVIYLIGFVLHVTGSPLTFNDETLIYSQLNMLCPSDKPLITNTENRSVCVSSCGPTMVADGKICINVEDCKKPVLSDGKCMIMCDKGYLYVTFEDDLFSDCGTEYNECYYSKKNIGQKLCEKKTFIILKIICYVIGIILYIVFLLMFFSKKEFPCNKLIMWLKVRNHMKKSSSRDLLCNEDITYDGFCKN
ncbi:uncharacterized protein LOC132732931 [Ruditapes philippinarum]|uniref:uncharacterized protein LOC132732931 n=1 Tax=Ruditapes philippinarum TaxID=129788 RepID=UPI00295BC731|nr:uncharacterized protein LOC132732931 [Ruditapes philippinarum]